MWSISCVHLEEVYFGKEMLSPFFLLQNSVADWGNSAERMPSWALDAWLLSSTCSLLFPFQKKMHLIKECQHMWL
jgi:hypothetical protein